MQSKQFAMTLFVAVATAITTQSAPEMKKPNILFIMAEDIGPDLACYGTKGVKTPTLDRLAAEGTRYTRFYTNSSICSPSRTALMLGMYPTTCGGQHHRSSINGEPNLHYMTYYLRQAGYICLNGSDVIKRKSAKTDINVNLNEPLFDKLSQRKPGQPFFHQVQLQVTHRQAGSSRWQDLRKSSAHPVKTEDIEIPPYLPDTSEVRLDWATYLDQIEQADLETQQLIDDLEQRGELDNTIIIWIADNGRCQIRGKGYLYEDGIHCPLIIWGKGIESGQVVDDLVANIDLTATQLAMAGVMKPDSMQGQAFLFNPDYQPNQYIFAARDRWDEIVDCSRTVVGKRYKYIHNFMPEIPYDAGQAYLDRPNVRPLLPLLREMNQSEKLTPEQAYFFNPEKEVEQLFDLENDPWELRNLANSPKHQQIKTELKDALFEWIESTGDKGLAKGSQGNWKPVHETETNKGRK